MEGDGGANQPKTLYVGNLDASVTEELMLTLFGQIGPVKGCKIIREPGGGDPYCFVEFTNHTAASTALVAMNRRNFLDKELKVNWATSSVGGGGYGPSAPAPAAAPGAAVKVDTSQHHHIFVGDLSPEIETENLRDAFNPFGEISDCRVVKDMVNQKSKGYGFVSFVHKDDAQAAIEQMNGQWLGSRAIRTNWATRKPPSVTGRPEGGGSSGFVREIKKLNYDDVFAQASAANCTAYCGGLLNGDENLIRRTFSPFGRIMEVRYFRDKGYAFIRYDNKESACNAIVAMHGSEINGNIVKCSWGKENGGLPAGGAAAAAAASVGYPQVPPGYMGGPPPAPPPQYYQQYSGYMYNPQQMAYGYATPYATYATGYEQGYGQPPQYQ